MYMFEMNIIRTMTNVLIPVHTITLTDFGISAEAAAIDTYGVDIT